MIIEASHILPQSHIPSRNKELQDAIQVHCHIASMNDVLARSIAHPEVRDMVHELHFLQDTIQPTPAGALILARSLNVRIQLLIRESVMTSASPIMRQSRQGNSTTRSQPRPAAAGSVSTESVSTTSAPTAKTAETPSSQSHLDARSNISGSV